MVDPGLWHACGTAASLALGLRLSAELATRVAMNNSDGYGKGRFGRFRGGARRVVAGQGLRVSLYVNLFLHLQERFW